MYGSLIEATLRRALWGVFLIGLAVGAVAGLGLAWLFRLWR